MDWTRVHASTMAIDYCGADWLARLNCPYRFVNDKLTHYPQEGSVVQAPAVAQIPSLPAGLEPEAIGTSPAE